MNKQQAIDLVRDTLEAPFEKARFVRFIKNLLNHVEDDGFLPRTGNYIPAAFKPYVQSLERSGIYSDGENRIDILIVHLKREISIERARTMQRNFVAGYLQGNYGSTAEKDAALVAFVSPSSEDWRFSLVKLEYRFEEKGGKVKVKEEFTPARRWSFLVGVHEKSHTAQSRLVPLIADDQHDPTLTELEEAFNIEVVTKEFFEKYRHLFIRAKLALDKALSGDAAIQAEFAAKSINTVDLAKKLLGQIVFLYYLQKKGWFGVPKDGAWGAGSKFFLRELFEKKHGLYENFFNDILEPLFYEALRIDRGHDDHYYRLFDCKIPFLNGGLFDPMGNYDWVRTDILLPNDLFSNKGKSLRGTKQSPGNQRIASQNTLAMTSYDDGDGILDIFDRYNFTVREDEPYEKEVAIDPELLGKAYEKFNAIRPDNFEAYLAALQSGKRGDETKFNKKFGVYYTPREIVHYMCQQSLIQYLYTEMNHESNVIASERTSASEAIPTDDEIASGRESAAPRNDMLPTKTEIETLILHGERIKEHDARVAAEGRETRDYAFEMPASIRANTALIDEKLASIKVCDPAVGSGAFPVGMMNEIVKARDVLLSYTSPLEGGARGVGVYAFKRACIENSLYGVDIDPGAVEIAKLRLWLSLVVDEDDIHHIKPLPNLDYKIVCGNSLIELVSPEFLAGTVDPKRTALVAQLKAAKDDLFNLTHPAQKEQKRAAIETLIQKLFQNYKAAEIRKLEVKIQGMRGQQGLFADAKISKADQKKLQTWEAEIRRLNELQLPGPAEHFEWHINFSEVFENDGFDVVIGNPPYVRQERLVDQKMNLMQYHPNVYQGTADLYVYFYTQSIQILRPNGLLALITNNKFMRASYGKQLRQFLSEETIPKILIDFGDLPVFDATSYPCIVIIQKASPFPNKSVKILTINNLTDIENLTLLMDKAGRSVPIAKTLTIDAWQLDSLDALRWYNEKCVKRSGSWYPQVND